MARSQAAGAVNADWLNTLTELGQDFAGPFGRGHEPRKLHAVAIGRRVDGVTRVRLRFRR